MDYSNTLQERAARLLALATRAQDIGDIELAELFTALALRYLDRDTAALEKASADELRRGAQQQQQPRARGPTKKYGG